MSTNNSSSSAVQDSVSAQQLAEEQHLFLHYESQAAAAAAGGGPNRELPAHLLPGHVTPEPPDHPADHGSVNSKDAKRNGHGKNYDF